MKTENHENRMRPAQQDSGMSILKTSPTGLLAVRLVPQSRPLVFKTSPAQRDSEISILGAGVLGILRILGILGEQPAMKTSPAQADSVNSKLGASRTGLTSPTSLTRPTEQQRAPAQRDSGNSILKTTSTQTDSEISIWAIRPLCPYCPLCPFVFKTSTLQRKTLKSH